MIRLVPFYELSEEESQSVLHWRNHPAIRCFMYTDREISAEEHAAFIASLRTRPDKHYFLVYDQNDPLGVIDLSDISDTTAVLGIYARPDQPHKGTGTLLMQALLDYASETLHLKHLRAECFRENLRAKHLYEKFDFRQTAQIEVQGREVIVMEKNL